MAQAINTADDTELAVAGTVNPQYFNGKRVLVLGASGLVGTGLTLALARLVGSKGSIMATGRNGQRLHKRFDPYAQDAAATTSYDRQCNEQGAICCTSVDVMHSLPQLGDFDIIINAASAGDPKSFAESPVETALANVTGVSHVLKYAVEHKAAQVLQLSSGEVYGYGTAPHMVSEDNLEYLPTLSPRSSYPMGKRMAETLCASYHSEYDLDVRIARPSHTFGPLFTASDSRVSADFFRTALRGDDIFLTSPGTQKRTYAYISDCVAGILSIVSSGSSARAYNVTNSANSVTLGQFAEAIAQRAQVHVHYGDDGAAGKTPTAESNPHYRLAELDDTRLRALGWQPQVDVHNGVARTIDTLLHLNSSVEMATIR